MGSYFVVKSYGARLAIIISGYIFIALSLVAKSKGDEFTFNFLLVVSVAIAVLIARSEEVSSINDRL